jgi:3-oxoadipate enol-lactonase
MRSAGHDLRIELNGFVIHYDDYGPIYAPVVLFIHGFPFNKQMWEGQIEELKNNYRVIAYDSRHPGAEGFAANHDLDLMVNDLFAILVALRIPKAALCGFSLGGLIAIEAVKRDPERFTALVLVDTCCESVVIAEKWWEKARRAIIRRGRIHLLNKYLELLLKLGRKPVLPSNRKACSIAPLYYSKDLVNASITSLLLLLQEQTAMENTCRDLADLPIPVLILVGEYSDSRCLQTTKQLIGELSDSRLQLVRFAGHFPNLENTEDFNERLGNFIQKYGRRRELSEPLLRKDI